MEIVIGMAASLLLQLAKKLAEKYGRVFSVFAIYGMIFIIAVAWAALSSVPSFDVYMKSIVSVFTSAIATYEVIIKRLGSTLPPPPSSNSDAQADAGPSSV